MAGKARFFLTEEMFKEVPHLLADANGFFVEAFRYRSGVAALLIKNSCCSFILLPFNGQQIWRYGTLREDFTMKSMYDEPVDTQEVFDYSYGAFLIHCGLTAMGNPSEEDDHPMHGELPGASYKDVYLEIGEDEDGGYLRAGGTFSYRLSIETGYDYEPSVKIYTDSTRLLMRNRITNVRRQPMPFMYMAHINWKPFEGGRLLYSAPATPEYVEAFDTYEGDRETDPLLQYIDKVRKDPSVAHIIDHASQCYDPEVCCSVHYLTDEAGWAHSLQVLPDGRACLVTFDTAYLPNGLRWASWTGDEDSMGFCLPNTGNHLGRAYAIAHDLRKEVGPKQSVTLAFDIAILEKKEADEEIALIERIVGGA